MKNVLILLLVASTVFFADRAVRAENQRYAMLIPMCEKPLVPYTPVLLWDMDCLDRVETRTSWFAHLLYVITEPPPPVTLWTE